MAIETLSIEWEHEDELPEMTALEYDMCYSQSEIIQGVRLFPYVTDWDHQKDCARKIYLTA